MKQNKETLKSYFETGDRPTETQFTDLIDSYVDAKQPKGEANRRFVIDEIGEVKVATEQKAPEYTLSSSSETNTIDLLKDGESVSQVDLVLKSNVMAKLTSSQGTQTTANLNIEFPLADNPIGTIVVNTSTSLGATLQMYIRIGDADWLFIDGKKNRF